MLKTIEGFKETTEAARLVLVIEHRIEGATPFHGETLPKEAPQAISF